MTRSFFILQLIALFSAVVFSQSGRIKPTESPSPTPRPRPVYQPTQPVQTIETPPPLIDVPIEDNEILRVESALVPIPVSVTDSRGRNVSALKIADFKLDVDGNEALIDDLYRSESPVRLALLFDNSSSVFLAREFEKKAAIKFFQKVLRPDRDLAALYSVASGVVLEQPLTRETKDLMRAINSLLEPKGATKLLDAIIEASNYLQDFQGRRVIVIVSDGEDNLSNATLEETVKAAQVNNCQIYVVKTTEFENFKRTGERSGSANVRYLSAERRMQELAAQTGGAVYSPIDEDELDRAFDQISAELSEQYILSYYPQDDEERRGEFRQITVSVKTMPGLVIRTRRGYYVPKSSKR